MYQEHVERYLLTLSLPKPDTITEGGVLKNVPHSYFFNSYKYLFSALLVQTSVWNNHYLKPTVSSHLTVVTLSFQTSLFFLLPPFFSSYSLLPSHSNDFSGAGNETALPSDSQQEVRTWAGERGRDLVSERGPKKKDGHKVDGSLARH